MLRMRRATSGVSETILPFGDIYFTLVDVGGQRSERRKWCELSFSIFLPFLRFLESIDHVL